MHRIPVCLPASAVLSHRRWGHCPRGGAPGRPRGRCVPWPRTDTGRQRLREGAQTYPDRRPPHGGPRASWHNGSCVTGPFTPFHWEACLCGLCSQSVHLCRLNVVMGSPRSPARRGASFPGFGDKAPCYATSGTLCTMKSKSPRSEALQAELQAT